MLFARVLGLRLRGLSFGCGSFEKLKAFGLCIPSTFLHAPPKILADFMFITNNFNLSGSLLELCFSTACMQIGGRKCTFVWAHDFLMEKRMIQKFEKRLFKIGQQQLQQCLGIFNTNHHSTFFICTTIFLVNNLKESFLGNFRNLLFFQHEIFENKFIT